MRIEYATIMRQCERMVEERKIDLIVLTQFVLVAIFHAGIGHIYNILISTPSLCGALVSPPNMNVGELGADPSRVPNYGLRITSSSPC